MRSKLSDCQILVFQNKIQKNFNTTNVEKEFLLIYGEVSEAFEVYKKNEINMGRKYIYNDMVMLRNLKINKI